MKPAVLPAQLPFDLSRTELSRFGGRPEQYCKLLKPPKIFISTKIFNPRQKVLS